jgi:N-acetylmuramoyl-L-alanine amidase
MAVGPHVIAPIAVAEPLPKATAPERAGQSTRFVIGLERATQFQVSSLNNPPRVIVDLPEVKFQLPLIPGDQPVGLVRSFRGGEAAPGRARVVIEATAPVIVEKAVMERGADGRSSRLVIDIAPAGTTQATQANPAGPQAKLMRAGASGLGAAGLTAAGIQPPTPRPAARPAANAAREYRPLIVLDPGHGGHDTGAQKFGTVEKDVVLAFGKLLRDQLVASNRYRVLMTRDNDSFIELDERRAFAEKHKAALFIAIHADYASTRASGATIYSLRESVADGLKRSARGSVRERIMAGRDLAPIKAEASGDTSAVKGFLADLAQREVDANKDRTSVFTQSVIEYMGRSTSLRDNPDRSAAFRVLKTAQLPAVLIELAYVSNQEDARNLRSEEWRRKVSQSIMTAIDNYFSHQSTQVPM